MLDNENRFVVIAGVSSLAGFIYSVKKSFKNPDVAYHQGLDTRVLHNQGVKLACRALSLATLMSCSAVVLGCVIFRFSTGVSSWKEFHCLIRSCVPTQLQVKPKYAQRNEPEFRTLKDLVDYLLKEDAEK